MDAKDNAGHKASPEDPNGTSTIRDQAHHIVVMPTTPRDGNTGTPVAQEEQPRLFKKKKKKNSHKHSSPYELEELVVLPIPNHDYGASAATCAPSTAKSENQDKQKKPHTDINDAATSTTRSDAEVIEDEPHRRKRSQQLQQRQQQLHGQQRDQRLDQPLPIVPGIESPPENPLNSGVSKREDEVKAKKSMTSETPEPTDTVDDPKSKQVPPTSLLFGSIRIDDTSIYEPQYVRIHTSDSIKDITTRMFERWDLPRPKLILSIVGGAESFKLSKSKIELSKSKLEFTNPTLISQFKHGLIDIATTTGAWITTPGSYTGVYEMIGSALKERIETEGLAAMKEIVLLGITSWGSVAGRELIVDKECEELNPTLYRQICDTTAGEGTRALDPNHSHFILVNDGTRDPFGRESTWRAAFENSLTERILSVQDGEEDVPVKVPIIKLLVNGDDGSLEACSKSLTEKMPLVAIAGSCGAAQVIVELHEFYTKSFPKKTKGEAIEEWSRSKNTLNKLGGIYKKLMGSKAQADTACGPKNKKLRKSHKNEMTSEPSDKVLEWLTVIAKHCELISVFDFLQHDTSSFNNFGLDKAILSAISHKHEKCATSDEEKIANQKAEMRLALAWNMVDYARENILNSTNPLYKDFVAKENFLFSVAADALVDDMPEFMKLLMEHGLVLKKFVTSERLTTLYQQSMEADDPFARIVKRNFEEQQKSNKVNCYTCCSGADDKTEYPPNLEDVGRMIKKLLGYSYPNIYSKKKKYNTERGTQTSYPNIYSKKKKYNTERDSAQQLFLWAILFNRMDLAEIFWQSSLDHVAGAIVGGAILKGLAKASYDQGEADIQDKYDKNSKTFELRATGILELCWVKDRQSTSDMLVRISHNWGDTTVLSMAYNAGMEDFLAQPACYNKLNTIWRGDIPLQIRLWRIYLFAVVPFMVFLLKLIPKGATDSRKNPTNRLMDERQGYPEHRAELDEHDEDDTSKNDCQISLFMDMKRAITSPIVKCIHYSLLCASFLAVYSLFLMTELRPFTTNTTGNGSSVDDSCGVCCPMSFSRIGCLEFITYACALSMILEEIHQALFRDYGTIIYVKQRLQDWISDVWNQLDLVSYISFTVAIILRFTLPVESFHWARIFFCFSLMVYFVRFSQIFYVVEQLGPKIIMIKDMMVDLAFFLVILSLTILTFGVICQSIFYPQSPLGWVLVNDVLYKPYFQMYGELFLEEFDGGYYWLLLGIYMILTNVLLLNLLIAMFSYTFQKVQDRSEILWKFNYYAVVHEHFDRPYIPLLGTLYHMIKKSYGCRFYRSDGKQENTDFRMKLGDERNKKISNFVKVCMKDYVKAEEDGKKEELTHKVTHTSKRMEVAIEELKHLREDDQKKPAQLNSAQASKIEALRQTHTKTEHRLNKLETTVKAKCEARDNLKSTLDQMNEMMRTLLQQQSSLVQSSSGRFRESLYDQ